MNLFHCMYLCRCKSLKHNDDVVLDLQWLKSNTEDWVGQHHWSEDSSVWTECGLYWCSRRMCRLLDASVHDALWWWATLSICLHWQCCHWRIASLGTHLAGSGRVWLPTPFCSCLAAALLSHRATFWFVILFIIIIIIIVVVSVVSCVCDYLILLMHADKHCCWQRFEWTNQWYCRSWRFCVSCYWTIDFRPFICVTFVFICERVKF